MLNVGQAFGLCEAFHGAAPFLLAGGMGFR